MQVLKTCLTAVVTCWAGVALAGIVARVLALGWPLYLESVFSDLRLLIGIGTVAGVLVAIVALLVRPQSRFIAIGVGTVLTAFLVGVSFYIGLKAMAAV